MPVTPVMDEAARLEALRGDARIRERVRGGVELTPAERLRAVHELCARGAWLRERQPVEIDRRLEELRRALDDDARAALRRLYGHGR